MIHVTGKTPLISALKQRIKPWQIIETVTNHSQSPKLHRLLEALKPGGMIQVYWTAADAVTDGYRLLPRGTARLAVELDRRYWERKPPFTREMLGGGADTITLSQADVAAILNGCDVPILRSIDWDGQPHEKLHRLAGELLHAEDWYSVIRIDRQSGESFTLMKDCFSVELSDLGELLLADQPPFHQSDWEAAANGQGEITLSADDVHLIAYGPDQPEDDNQPTVGITGR